MNDARLSLRSTVAAIGASVVVALLLRLAGSGDRTLFWDEAYHVKLVILPTIADMLGAILANPPSDPLYALLLRGWAQVAGTGDLLVRLPSIVFGAGTPLAAAWLGWEMTRDRRVAVVAAWLVAISPYLVEFGQEASLYAFATLTTTLALASGWRWLRSGTRADGALAVALAILAVYSHYVAAAVLGLVALLSLTRLSGPRSVSPRAVLGAMGLVGLAWLPWAGPMVASWVTAEAPRTAVPTTASVKELLGALSQYSSGTGALLDSVRPVQIAGIAAAGILVVRGWFVARRRDWRGLRVVVVTSAVLFVGPWLVSVISGHWTFVAHLMLFLLPALAVVAAAGAVGRTGPQQMTTQAPNAVLRNLAIGAAVVLVVAQVAGLAIDAVDPPHGNYGTRELASDLAAAAATGDEVFIAPNELQPVLEQYAPVPVHGLPTDLDLRHLYRFNDPAIDLQANIDRFTLLTGGDSRAWLVYSAAREGDRLFLEWLMQHAGVELRATYPIGELYEIDLTTMLAPAPPGVRAPR